MGHSSALSPQHDLGRELDVYLAHPLGAVPCGSGGYGFRVWAPRVKELELHLLGPRERLLPLERLEHGYFEGAVADLPAGARYTFRLDGRRERPDPASRGQPEGVHGPSEVLDPAFAWQDETWRGLPLERYLLYELHVGTFSAEGTFDAVIPQLERLVRLGVTAIELMPIAQFPGSRNWGYDGVYPFAAQASYGGSAGLKRLVQACHQRGLAVVLDVVYNHLGPEGSYLAEYGPYFTARYHTPWGEAVNFDGPASDHVRAYFIQQALYWLCEHHLDALRLDALHALLDFSARPFLEELAAVVHREGERLGRPLYLIGESDLNDTRLIRPREQGGFALDSQWSDDFHHALHSLLTEERGSYYEDFGALEQLAEAYRDGYVYTGQYSSFRARRHGNSTAGLPASKFVVCAQNHDQVGNRPRGERLSALVDFERLKLAAAATILSPFLPLLFMGEEYGELAPFQYFISHGDPALIAAIRAGRRSEFGASRAEGEPPDPQAEETFTRSRLAPELRERYPHAQLEAFYRELLALRGHDEVLSFVDRDHLDVQCREPERLLLLRRWQQGAERLLVLHMAPTSAHLDLPLPPGPWARLLDSAEQRWGGPGTELPAELPGPGKFTLGAWSAVLLRSSG